MRHWCATGEVYQWKGTQIINPGSVAEACKAAAQWEALKAKAHAMAQEEEGICMPGDEMTDEALALALTGEEPEEAVELAWDGSPGRFTDEQYKRSCLIVGTGKSDSHLPVREPDGTLNCGGVSAAASRINQASASPEAKKGAAKELISLMRNQCDSEPSAQLLKLAGGSAPEKKTLSERLTDLFKQGLAILSREEGDELPEEVATVLDADVGRARLEDEPAEERGAQAPEEAEALNLAYQLPVLELKSERVGRRRFRRPILRVGDRIDYEKGGLKQTLRFTSDWVDQMISNFKAKAFPQVPLLALHPKDSAVDPDKYFGEVVDLERDDEWAYATFETTERGAKAIEDNPKLPTSMGFFPKLFRKADKKLFDGPCLQHIATTYTPYDPSLAGTSWASVHMSNDEATEVVDLTGAQFSVSGEQGKESGPPVSDAVAQDENTPEEVTEGVRIEEIELSAEARQLIAEEQAKREALEAQVAALSAREAENTRAREAQAVELRLSTDYATVPRWLKKKLEPLLLSEVAKDELETVELAQGEDGKVVKTTSKGSVAEKVWEILDGLKKAPISVALGEEGDAEATPVLDEEELLDKRARVLMGEKDVEYPEALELAMNEGVN